MKTLILLILISLTTLEVIYPQEKSSPKFSGLMFGDYFYNIDQRDSTKKDLNGFQFRRIYFTADYSISESFDSRFRLEADQSANSLTSGGKVGVMVKDAYLKWKNIFEGSDFIFGISPTPVVDVSEAIWGYRSLEKTITDLNGIVSSRDLGVDLKGKIADNGSVKYWIKVANNSSNAPEVNKYKRFYGLIQLTPLDNFQVVLYGDYASYAPKTDPFDKQSKSNGAFVGDVMLNVFQKDVYSIGIESFYKLQQNNFSPGALSPLQSQKGFGISASAWVAILSKLRIVGRYDVFDPNNDKGNDRQNLILGALDFQADKNVSIMPNVEIITYQGIDPKDLVGRITLSYQF